MPHRLYFAYGSNMDFDQMEFRCPGAKFLGVATLPHHRLRMDSAGYATVVPDPNSHVQGALWNLDGADESKMDYYEGVESGFYEKAYVSVLYDGDLRDDVDEGFTQVYGHYAMEPTTVSIDALIYLSLRAPFSNATFRDYYLTRIRNGAQVLRLGDKTLQQIDAIRIIPASEIRPLNRQRLIDYIAAGCREHSHLLGVEVEHFIVHEDALGRKDRVSYEPHGSVIGTRDVLSYLSQYYAPRDFNSRGDVLGLSGLGGSVTLEPASQLEFSVAPFEQISNIDHAYRLFREQLDSYLSLVGCSAVNSGYHPFCHARELPLIPRSRYRFMDQHFRYLDTHGERMMRACAATQVSIDYADEADAVRKFRVACALAPILGFICDNTSVYEGAPVDTPLTRLNLWREVDSVRCGTTPGTFDEGFGFAQYADWILSIPPIYITRPSAEDPRGPRTRGFSTVSTADAYADAPMSEQDILHALSMCWPDVRLKQFVEIRPADSLPPAQVAGYAALIKGLFYSEESLRAIEEAIGVKDVVWPLDDQSATVAISAIIEQGADADVYGMPAQAWVELLFELARRALPDDEVCYLEDLHAFYQGKQK